MWVFSPNHLTLERVSVDLRLFNTFYETFFLFAFCNLNSVINSIPSNNLFVFPPDYLGNISIDGDKNIIEICIGLELVQSRFDYLKFR